MKAWTSAMAWATDAAVITQLGVDFNHLAGLDQEAQRALRHRIRRQLLARRRIQRLDRQRLAQLRAGRLKRLRQLGAMRRAPNDRPRAHELALAQAGHQRIEQLVERQLALERVAQVGERHAAMLGVRSMRGVDDLGRFPAGRLPGAGVDDDVAHRHERAFADEAVDSERPYPRG